MTPTLYQTDFYAWTQQQAALLKGEEFTEVDWQNLIEEVESMGRSEQRELESRLTTIMLHLLKIVCEPRSQAVSGWKNTILTQRIDLRRHLKANATLRAHVADYVADVYQDARLLAADTTQCAVDDFPARCPWTAEQLLDVNWLP